MALKSTLVHYRVSMCSLEPNEINVFVRLVIVVIIEIFELVPFV